MTLPALLPLLLAATIDVAPGADPAAAVRGARPGDVVRLAPGVYPAALGRLRAPLQLVGAGAGVTVVLVPEGEDGLVVEAGEVRLEGFTLRAQGPRAALKVLGGSVQATGVAIAGGSTGLFVGGGRFAGRDLDLSGGYALLQRSGEVALVDTRVRGELAGVAQLGGRSDLRRLSVTGPSSEAAITVSGGSATLAESIVRSPGPTGLSVAGSARVEARSLSISGATEDVASTGTAIQGDCVQMRRGTLKLTASNLTRCGGAAVEASSGSVDLRGVDATGGEAGCLVFMDHADARLEGNRCMKRGPAVVAASGAQVHAAMNRWTVDPVLWVECGSGARIHLGVGELARQPCGNSRESLDKPGRP